VTAVSSTTNGRPVAQLESSRGVIRRRPRTKSPRSATAQGFDLHAGVTVRAGDREALERLCRYGARPCFSLERLSVGARLADGRVAYRLRKRRRNGATHLVMMPVHFSSRAMEPQNVPRRRGPAYVDAEGWALLGLSARVADPLDGREDLVALERPVYHVTLTRIPAGPTATCGPDLRGMKV
jgi:hypothetical protein